MEKAEPKDPKVLSAAAAAAAADVIISVITDEIIICDLEGNILRVNKAWEKGSGFKAEELVGKSVFELPMPKGFADNLPKLLQEIIEKGQLQPIESIATRKDGTQYPVLFSASLIRDDEGKPMNIVSVSKNITELKRLQEKEKEAAAALEMAAVIDAMPDGLVILNLNGEIISANLAHLEMGGHKSLDEIIGRSFSEQKEQIVDVEKVLPKLLELFKEVVEKSHPVGPIEVGFSRKDGQEKTVSVIAGLVRDVRGNPKNIVVNLRDVSALKKLEFEIKRSEEKFKLIIENIRESYFFYSYDKNGKIRYVSPSVVAVTGYSQEEFVQDYEKYLMDNPLNEKARKFKEALMQGGKPPHGLFQIVCRDKHVRWLEISGFPMLDDKGSVLSVDLIAKDVTEHKQLDDSLKRSEKMYDIFIDATSDMVFLKDEKFQYSIVNQACARYFGKNKEEIKGKTDFDLLPKESAENCLKSDQQALRSEGVVVTEEKAGDKIYETRKFRVDIGDNRFGVGGYIRDVAVSLDP